MSVHNIKPLVSVSLLTYNQRELIGRAIQSVLDQRTAFPIELIIGDDASSDGTQQVLLDYQKRYPDQIQLILHPRRYEGEVPGRTNNVTNLRACRGKYTAMLDGDDYWTDAHKLQRQVDVLESRKDIVACSHDSTLAFAPDFSGRRPPYTTINGRIGCPPSGVYSLADVLPTQSVLVKPSSLMFRTRIFGDFPEWFWQVVYADVVLLYLILEQGELYYDARPMAAQYLNHQSFVRSFLHEEWIVRRRIWEIRFLRGRFGTPESQQPFQRQLANLEFRLARILKRDRNYGAACIWATKSISTDYTLLTKLIRGQTKKLFAAK